MSEHSSLARLGWQPFFEGQIAAEEKADAVPVRVMKQHKSAIEVANASGVCRIATTRNSPTLTVGDWLLLDSESKILRVLDRRSCFRRAIEGKTVSEQLIAANVDTAFIVCSLNEDFSLSRIERYLSIVNEAGADAVIVLSKMDLCEDAESLLESVQQLDGSLCIQTMNCLDEDNVSLLSPWCEPGKTVAMLGSSGAGKSTLTNSLLKESIQETAPIRESDQRGRHTTTGRSLLTMPNGAMIMDTPGMRALQLADCRAGVGATFADIESLAQDCRFKDCKHRKEPNCAIHRAIDSGALDERRFLNYRTLLAEQEQNSASIAAHRGGDRKARYRKRVGRDNRREERRG